MNKLLLLGMLLTFPYLACCQIWVEITSRSDTFSILGSNSDNKVRIHNLPANAKVEVEYGKAIRIDGGNFVLCQFKNFSGNTNLLISQQDSIVFKRSFHVLPTRYSQSIYNPQPRLPIRNISSIRGLPASKTITPVALKNILKNGISIEEANCKVISANICGYAPGMDIWGPYCIGLPNGNCDSIFLDTRNSNSILNDSNYNYNICYFSQKMQDTIFHFAKRANKIQFIIDNIKAKCPETTELIKCSSIYIRIRS
jgi:hypothetical protein